MELDISCLETPYRYLIYSVIIITMALRGFSTFEAKFRAKMAKATPVIFFFRLNPSDEEIEILKKEIDLDGSGEIDFKEFLTLMNSKTLRYVKDNGGFLRSAFNMMKLLSFNLSVLLMQSMQLGKMGVKYT